MSLNDNRIFRSALLIESAINVSSMFPLILNPDYCLSFLVRGPSQITPATTSLMQWFGGMIVLATAPLLLSYPEPGSGESASVVTARRRITYMMMGTGEAALGLLTASQYMSGNSGLTDQALLTATAMMGTFSMYTVGYNICLRPTLIMPNAFSEHERLLSVRQASDDGGTR